ncbi:MAG: hypothetical protein RLY64_181 [Bacteroidota bacterium]
MFLYTPRVFTLGVFYFYGMNVVLFDDASSEHLRPFTLSKPSAYLRTGILTNVERWKQGLNPTSLSNLPFRSYLNSVFGKSEKGDLFINGRWLPTEKDFALLLDLTMDQCLVSSAQEVLACKTNPFQDLSNLEKREVHDATVLRKPWEIFSNAGFWIQQDFQTLTRGCSSQALSSSNRVIGDPALVFLEEGAKAECAIFNTTSGPIYLGKNAEVMEGAIVRGPFSLGEKSQVKMGAKIYEDCIIGPFSKVGGEVGNSVIMGYSNKGHDGYLGNSVLGEWCNLGADTNTSNLKNNYAPVKLWNYSSKRFDNTGLQFCGLMMGDHSKSGINTMFNTGTVVGVGSNIFGDGFPRNFIPSFSWGGSSGFILHQFPKFLETAKIVYQRRGMEFDENLVNLFQQIFTEETSTEQHA